jgi:t-SNARE complex subunit (syntaxin)
LVKPILVNPEATQEDVTAAIEGGRGSQQVFANAASKRHGHDINPILSFIS